MLPVVIAYIALGLVLIILATQKNFRRIRPIAGGLVLTWLMLGVLLGGAEVYLRCCYAASDTPMQWTMAGHNWMTKYMALNSRGYRDREWVSVDLEGKTIVLVVGDSFTEGWGIENPAHRFSDRLQAELGDDYAVVNLGKGGTSTLQQTQAVAQWVADTGLPPDVVIWQYLLNDIDIAAISNGLTWESPVPLPDQLPALVQESALVNWLYWQSARLGMFTAPDGTSQWDWLYSAYDNSYIWEIHASEITRMARGVEEIGARLITVIFPNMEDPVASVPYVDRVAQHLSNIGHPEVLKMTDAAAAMPLDERLVSRADAHPSAAFNQVVTDLLLRLDF